VENWIGSNSTHHSAPQCDIVEQLERPIARRMR
jgi:hypothetical protein